jgi:hypothetical protein
MEEPSRAASATPLRLDEQVAKFRFVDVVPKPLDPLDLDDGYPLAILPLEGGIGRDIDDFEAASHHGSHRIDGRSAEMTAGGGVDDDARCHCDSS